MTGGPSSIGPEFLAIPPTVVLTLLICWFHGSLFFLLDGARGRQLLFYLAVATISGSIGQVLANVAQFTTVLDVGDCSVVSVISGCWVGFALTRLIRVDHTAEVEP